MFRCGFPPTDDRVAPMANRRRLNARSSNSLQGHRRSDHQLHPPLTCCYRCNQSSVTFNHTGILIRLQMVLSVNAFAPGPRSPPQERERNTLCTPARDERDLFCICLWLMFSYRHILHLVREKEMAHHDVFPVFTPYTHSHWRDRCFSFRCRFPRGADLTLFSFQTLSAVDSSRIYAGA